VLTQIVSKIKDTFKVIKSKHLHIHKTKKAYSPCQ